MRFVYLGSRFTLLASSPRSVALTQLRFARLAVASSAGDFHPEDRAHAGRTTKHPAEAGCFPTGCAHGREPVREEEDYFFFSSFLASAFFSSFFGSAFLAAEAAGAGAAAFLSWA